MSDVSAERERFIRKHGGMKKARRLNANYFVFPDGALLDWHPLGENFEPPKDQVELLQLILAYRRIILKETFEAFQQCKNMVQCFFNPNYAGNYCGPTYYGTQEEALELLRQKRNAVWNAKYAVEEVVQALDALTNPPSKVKQQAAIDQQLADQHLRFMDDLNKITI